MYPVPLSSRLPNCRIPLRPSDGEAVLNLPAVLERVYAVGGYDLMIDYTVPPTTFLTPEEEGLIKQLTSS